MHLILLQALSSATTPLPPWPATYRRSVPPLLPIRTLQPRASQELLSTLFEASSTRSCSGVWKEATLHPSNVHLPCPLQTQDAHSPATKLCPLILNTQSNHYSTLLCVLSTATTPLPRARQACRQDQFLRYYLVTLHAFNKLSRTSSLQPSKPVKLVSCSRKRDTTLRPF